jgi:hypothetical protein
MMQMANEEINKDLLNEKLDCNIENFRPEANGEKWRIMKYK